MRLEEKVGQLMMVGFAGTEVSGEMVRWVRDRHVGGVALFSRNLVDVAQIRRFTRELSALSAAHTPVFIALDQEGGAVVRVREGATLLPGNMALGATREPTLAYVAGQALAIDLRLLGFNMNLAPVLDVNSNPSNPVIGIRSYGERADLVGTMGEWYVRGQQEMGVVAVAKHFPGHGDTQADSHFAMPAIDADLARLERLELSPFRQAMAAGLDAVMTAHIAVPRLAEQPSLPATLSHRVLGKILRQRMGFDGLVLTDGLEMQGIVRRYGSGRAAVMAVQAGADMPMVLWSHQAREEVYRSLLRAARRREITPARLNASVRRILQVKLRRGLLVPPPPVSPPRDGPNALHALLAARIAREGITLVRNDGHVLPLRPRAAGRVAVLAPPGPFADAMAARANTEVVEVPFVPTRAQRRELTVTLAAAARRADVLVMGVINRYHLDVARAAAAQAPGVATVLVSFASPYYLHDMPEVTAYACTYSYLDASQHAAAAALWGEAPMTGRLPVSIPGLYAYGHAMSLPTVPVRAAALPAATP